MAQSNLGKAYVQIVPSAQGISGSISSVLNGEADSAGKSTGAKLIGTIKKAIVAAGIGKILKDTIQEGARYEQGRGGIETLFGAKGAKSAQEYAKMVGKTVNEVSGEYNRLKAVEDQMMKNANDAWKTAGISANEYMEQSTSFAASLLQSVGGNQAKAAEAANQAVIDMSDNANKMGTNIQDIQNAYQGFAKQNYTMLDNLKLGYGGTKTEMERLLADAEKVTGVKYDINNLSDVYEAIHVVQGELGITGTTAKEAESTLSGSFASMKASASNFMAQLVVGEDVSGAMDGVLESAITFGKNLLIAVGNVFLNLPDSLGHLAENIIAKLQESGDDPAIGNAAGEFIKNFAIGIFKNLPKLAAAALSLVGYLISQLGVAAEGLIQSGAKAIANWASGLWTGFTASASATLENIKASITAKFESIKASISTKAAAAIASVKTKFAEAKAAITKPFETARDKVKDIVEKIKGFFKFKVSTPHIPKPTFSISPSGWKLGDLLKGTIPKLSIAWHKEGVLFTKPTVVHGFGEAGAEAGVPLTPFWKTLDEWGESIVNGTADAASNGIGKRPITIVLQVDGREVAKATAPYMETEMNKRQTRANRKLGYI